MLLTQSKRRRGYRQRTVTQGISIGPTSMKFLTIIILAAAAMFYLAQSTQSATKNYKVHELEESKEQLELEKQRLEIESLRLRSLSEIKTGAQNLEMETSKEFKYVSTEKNK